MNVLINVIIVGLAAFFAFKVSWILGTVFLLVVAGYMAYSKYPDFMAGRGNAEYSKGNIDKAVSYYEKAVARKAVRFTVRIGYASILLRAGRPDEALENINKILSRTGLSRDVKNQAKQLRILINYKLKNNDEALDEAIELFEAGYTNSHMYCIVGLMMIACNKPEAETLEFCERAYDYDNESRDIVDNYLLALIRSGKLDKAAEISDKLIEMAPEFVEAYYHGAMLYNAAGDRERAVRLLDKIPECKRTYMTTVSESEIKDLYETVS